MARKISQENKYATLLNAVSATGPGAAVDLSSSPLRHHAWEIVVTGAPTASEVHLQGSLDNTNWYTLDTSTTTSSELRFVVDKPVRFVRANWISVSGGTAPTVTVRYLGFR